MDMQREPVVIIGAGGHAKEVIDIIRTQGLYGIVGCLDQAESCGRSILGVKIIGNDSLLAELFRSGIKNAFVAIGDNRIRAEKARQLQNLGFCLINALSPYAYIADTVSLQAGIVVMPGAVVNVDCCIMANAIVNTKVSLAHDCILGAFSHIGPGSTLAGNVQVGEGAFIGTGTSIIPRINVGNWSVTGAGAVIVADIPESTLVIGVPGKVVRNLITQGECHENTGITTKACW